MAGIYLHIPFCKTRCAYCDFYSTTREELKSNYINALCKELRNRHAYLQGETIETIYLGGGTPSQLGEADFRQIFATIEEVYGMKDCKEITLEANPDDLTESYVEMLATLPFNRVSMGIQTFDDNTLKLLNRRHTALQAKEAVGRLRKHGFQNISIDLIYGLPGETEEQWMNDLQQAVSLKPEHISAYHLTYEEGTPLYRLLMADKIEEVNEEDSVHYFEMLMDYLKASGYEHYEISNFALPDKHSRHNSSYWHGVPYLGCGPSAHSFDGHSRQWNIASLEAYIDGMKNGDSIFELEELDIPTRYNEAIMTGLRTSEGVNLDRMASAFGAEYRDMCMKNAAPFLRNGKLILSDNYLKLSREGIFISDGIISELMVI